MIFIFVAHVFLVKVPIALVLRHWLLAWVQICVNYIFCNIHHALLPALLFLPAVQMFPESLSGKYLLLFHCSLLACINPVLYYILPSVCYHLCWEDCFDNLQDLDLLLFHDVMFSWMTSPANPWAGYLRSDQRRFFQISLAS